MRIPIYVIDAFAEKKFTGNPAAVCLTERELPAGLMQSIAAENNLAETAFVVSAPGAYSIRWFTPVTEVDLCGHATLASAHVIFNYTAHRERNIVFSSRSGPLGVTAEGDVLVLDFPADVYSRVEPVAAMDAALGIRPRETYLGKTDYMVVLQSHDEVEQVKPDFPRMKSIPCRGVIVTAPGRDVDFVSRFFAPQSGIDEDPVTGSAHTTLIPYWSGVLGKIELKARQLSRRGGTLHCAYHGDRVRIGGRALTYLTGTIDTDM